MCWSSAFDPFEGSTLGSKSVPGGRTDRSREPSRARAVRRLGVPVGMGGKANCLCLRGIWETPKPRYREETKPVVKLPGTTFRAKDPACHARSWGRDTVARKPRGRAPSGETHLRREARASFATCLGPAVRVRSPSRSVRSVRVSLSRPGRDRLAAASLSRRAWRRLGRHHRHADNVSGGAVTSSEIAGRNRGEDEKPLGSRETPVDAKSPLSVESPAYCYAHPAWIGCRMKLVSRSGVHQIGY